MDEAKQKEIYDKVADHIDNNRDKINEILSNCAITSNFFSEETIKKYEEILNFDVSSCILNEPSEEQYDINTINSIFKMLETTKPANHQKLLRSTSERSMSVASLALSEHDQQENTNEVLRQLKEVSDLLKGIKNCPMQIPDLTKIKQNETEKRNKFTDLVFQLQRLAKEMKNIATTDNLKDKVETVKLDDAFLEDLNHLSKVN